MDLDPGTIHWRSGRAWYVGSDLRVYPLRGAEVRHGAFRGEVVDELTSNRVVVAWRGGSETTERTDALVVDVDP